MQDACQNNKTSLTSFLTHVVSSFYHHTMGKSRRQSALTKSIQAGLLRDPDRFKTTAWGHLIAFFTLYRIKLIRFEEALFARLRQEIWKFNESEYQASFRTTSGQLPLKSMGDLGYSGSVSWFQGMNSFGIWTLTHHTDVFRYFRRALCHQKPSKTLRVHLFPV
jgi:hypothetical protein